MPTLSMWPASSMWRRNEMRQNDNRLRLPLWSNSQNFVKIDGAIVVRDLWEGIWEKKQLETVKFVVHVGSKVSENGFCLTPHCSLRADHLK